MSEGTIRYLTAGEKQDTRLLWEEAFPEDSREFGDYYYQEKLKDNRILAVTEGEGPERVQAMIHLNPYRVMVRDRCWHVDYLVGVATRRQKRHQGYMRRLLLRMMADMRDEQMPFCFLMPADPAIYRPFGFTYIFRQPRWELLDGAPLERKDLVTLRDSLGGRRYLGELAEWIDRWLKKRYQVYVRRDGAYMRRLIREIASEDGNLEALFANGHLAGLVSHWGLREREQRLLYGEAPYVREAAEPKPAIMARIITPEVFVRAVRLREKEAGTGDVQTKEETSSAKPDGSSEEQVIRLRLTDPLIEANDGVWLWHLTRETSWLEREKAGPAAADGPEQGPEIAGSLALTIDELTSWLFGYELPEAARPCAELVEVLRGVFLDEVV